MKIKLGRLSLAILIILFIMNAYFSISTMAHRVIKYLDPERAGGYLIFRQLNVHVFYKMVIFINGTSLLYLYICITK